MYSLTWCSWLCWIFRSVAPEFAAEMLSFKWGGWGWERESIPQGIFQCSFYKGKTALHENQYEALYNFVRRLYLLEMPINMFTTNCKSSYKLNDGNTYRKRHSCCIKMKMLEVPESISLLNSGLSSVFNMVIEKHFIKNTNIKVIYKDMEIWKQ